MPLSHATAALGAALPGLHRPAGRGGPPGRGGLPYGDRRQLENARALAAELSVLLLDELAAGANLTEKRALMELIACISALGTPVVSIEHDVALVMSISDRVTVLEYGRTITEGPPAEIWEDDPCVIAACLGVPDDPETDLVTEVLR